MSAGRRVRHRAHATPRIWCTGMMSMSRERAMQGFAPDAEHSDSDAEFAALFGLMGQFVFAAAGAADDAARLSARFLERFWTADNWVVFPDVLSAFETLRRHDVRIGVLSNASSELVAFLAQLGLAPHLDFTVVSAVEGRKKPDRRLYEVALQRAGAAPADMVHVGDMYVEDILGARNAGVRPFLIERGRVRDVSESPGVDRPAERGGRSRTRSGRVAGGPAGLGEERSEGQRDRDEARSNRAALPLAWQVLLAPALRVTGTRR